MAEQKTPVQYSAVTGEPITDQTLYIAPSPTDQRILAAAPHTEPLEVLAKRAVEARGDSPGVDFETHVGPSLQEDPLPGETPLAYVPAYETPKEDITIVEQDDQGVTPPNDLLLDSKEVETTIAEGPYKGNEAPENEGAELKTSGQPDQVTKTDLGITDEEAEAADTTVTKAPAEDLGGLSKPELVEKAREAGVGAPTTLNKPELIEAIEAKQA